MVHPDDERRLRDCIDGLSSEGAIDSETLMQATKKAFEAITGKLRAFLSYKRARHADVAELPENPSRGSAPTRSRFFWTQ